MSILTIILIVAYCIIGFIFHTGINSEYKKDTSSSLDHLSPAFIKTMMAATCICWPLLVLLALYQKINKEK